MKNLPLLRYFTFYSLIAFLLTGVFLILFINSHMVNDKIDSIEQLANLTLYSPVAPELSPKDYNTTLSKEKFNILDMKLMHLATN
jgi:hypothetical protein